MILKVIHAVVGSVWLVKLTSIQSLNFQSPPPPKFGGGGARLKRWVDILWGCFSDHLSKDPGTQASHPSCIAHSSSGTHLERLFLIGSSACVLQAVSYRVIQSPISN